ncbi:MAG: hypothetical protein AAF670_11715 [Planctomycetota bacterium]
MLATTAAAGEPAQDFLKQLRAAGLHDQAIAYLDRLDTYPGVDPDMLSAVALEKAQTHIDAIVTARTVVQRDAAFDAAMSELKVFLKNPNHPRQPEAQAQLGKLQMVRGAQILAGDDGTKVTEARQSFMEAAETFDAIIESLRSKLAEMQGVRIDPTQDPEKAARRDQYRFEFLQAQANAGEARLAAAETHANPSKDAKQVLEEALSRFTDLSEKYEKYIQGASAYFSRGQVEQLLGQTDQALESYTRMLEQPDADELRVAKMGATAALMGMAMDRSPPNVDEAIRLGEEFVNTIRPNEKALPEVQTLRLTTAKALLMRSEDKKTKASLRKRAIADARKLLLDAKRHAGEHMDETESMLASMGIDSSVETAVELPEPGDDPASFDEALAAARGYWSAGDSIQKQLNALGKTDDNDEQRQDLLTSLTKSRESGIAMLRRGLALVDAETDSREVHEARQLLTFLLFSEDRLRESHVVGHFLARSAPGTDAGLRGGLLALSALQRLIGEEALERYVPEIESLGDFLAATWPEDPKAAMAKGILIRLALSQDQFDKASQMIAALPDGAEKKSFLRIQGQLKYQQSKNEEDGPAAPTMMRQAVAELQSGFKGLTLIEPADLQAALTLAKAQMAVDDPKAAVTTLEDPKIGPIKLISKVAAPSDGFASELHRTHLQALVGQITTSSGDTDALLDRAGDAMEQLRQSVQGEEGQKRLISIFLSLASDIRKQLDSANPQRRDQLIAAFRIFLSRISETTRDPATLQWVGQTLMEMGQSVMLPGEVKATGQAGELLTMAGETFEKLKDESDVPQTVSFLRGKALRLVGDYSQAIDQLESLLKVKPTMLDAQSEAALAYEQWAGTLRPALAVRAYKAAMSGGRPGADGKNTVWGWGKISQVTMRQPKFLDNFFDARYHIALCRYQQGKAASDRKITEQAAKDITSVANLYPELGGPERRSQFDRLLRKIQTELGQTPEGLPPLARVRSPTNVDPMRHRLEPRSGHWERIDVARKTPGAVQVKSRSLTLHAGVGVGTCQFTLPREDRVKRGEGREHFVMLFSPLKSPRPASSQAPSRPSPGRVHPV